MYKEKVNVLCELAQFTKLYLLDKNQMRTKKEKCRKKMHSPVYFSPMN